MSEDASKVMPGEKDGKHRRAWLVLGGLVLMLLGALVWLFAFHDAPAPDDADMMPRWSERGGKANPLARFLEAAGATEVRKYSALPPEVTLLEERHVWKADEFLREQHAMFAALEELLRTDPATWQWPEPQRLIQFQLDETPEYLSLLQDVTGTIRMKAQRLAALGRMSEAAELCLMLARFGRGAQGAEGGFLQLLPMMRAQQQGETLLEKVLTREEASPALLRHCIAELERIEGPSREGIQFAVKINYQWFKHFLSDKEMRGKLLESTYSKRGAGWINRFLVKPHRCLNARLEFDRPLLEGLSKDWPHAAAALHTEREELHDMLLRSQGTRLQRMLDSNLGGRVVVLSEVTDQHSIVENLARGLMSNRQIRIVLALRLHELEKGALPGRLQELVPAYLPSVPIDEHSGGPMKWDHANLIIYSVGADRVDDHGSIGPSGFPDSKDDGMRNWWWGTFSVR